MFPKNELFNYYANAGSVLFKLARNAEAESMLDRALQMFPEEPSARQPQDALEAFDAASQASEQSPLDKRVLIQTSVAAGRARAWASLVNLSRASAFSSRRSRCRLAMANYGLHWLSFTVRKAALHSSRKHVSTRKR